MDRMRTILPAWAHIRPKAREEGGGQWGRSRPTGTSRMKSQVSNEKFIEQLAIDFNHFTYLFDKNFSTSRLCLLPLDRNF